jgi:predicted nucleotidyltransferase
MNADDPNIEMVEFIAGALGGLTQELVFVGGCAAGLMITDRARAAIRATNDVDLIAEVAGIAQYYPLTDQLKIAGFVEDSDVVCRWLYKGVKVDVMPTDENILGFSNQWYEGAIQTSGNVSLPSGKIIRLITPPFLIATKIDAFYGRGDGDYQGSHDLEDIISVVDGRPELIAEIESTNGNIRDYLSDEIDSLLGIPAFSDSIPYHLKPDGASQARVPIILERLRRIAG